MPTPLRLARLLAALSVVASLLLGVGLAEMGLHPGRTHDSRSEREEAAAIGARAGRPVEDVSLVAADGVTLRAWFFPAATPTRPVVILTHGVSAHRGHSLGLARIFVSQGYAVLAPDARGHGESDGVATFGVREGRDVRAWADLAFRRQTGTCLFGVGVSMGAAQLLQAAADDPRWCGIVAEASFSSFREVAYDRVGQFAHTGPWLGRTVARPAIEAAFVYARLRYGVDLGLASPVDAVRRLRAPVLLIHGGHDDNIPVRHGKAIAAAGPTVRLWIIPDAGHGTAWSAAPGEYERRVVEFIRRRALPR
jgi:uncharacterized protein